MFLRKSPEQDGGLGQQYPEDEMEKQYRLRKNGQFRYVYKKGKGSACREISLGYVKGARLLAGFAVSK